MNIPELESMLGHYLNEQIAAVEDAIAKKDDIKVKQIGHKLKGNSGSIALGKPEINEFGKEIELSSTDFEKVKGLLVQLTLSAKSFLKES